MEKKFQPVPVDRLGRWIFDGLGRDEVMGLPRSAVRLPDDRMKTVCLDQVVGAPLGVAAGPHTQLAHNIVAAWLCGARFIELKTVQILDEISVSRPCIDSADVTYNCEWSQELSLEQSFDEYLAAWVLIHALAHHLGRRPDVFFNMSVGYDLDGIRSEKVQRFLRRMRDAKAELTGAVDALAAVVPSVRDVDIPASMSSLVTLSTMHGCPPAEIERIAKFMLEDLGIDTWVKLNPTLLGPEMLRGILNEKMGFDVVVEDSAFDHDPKFEDAMQMVRNLDDAARKCGRRFGVKLSNTLEVSNRRTIFPPNEKSMYMSGRALHPLTVTLAHRVTETLDGRVPLSFCGGADAFNFPTLVADGLGPVTTCTDLLKPGGYARLSQYVDSLTSALDETSAASIDELILARAGAAPGTSVEKAARDNLARHAEQVLADPSLRRRLKPLQTKGERVLGSFDCIAAPCQEACPTHQNIPDYLRLVAAGKPSEALDLILHTNAMPAVTGRVCDHPCMERCVRNHYESPLAIRAIKRHAVANAVAGEEEEASTKRGVRVAVVGAGPAGLSAAYYLARAACSVTVFESKPEPGGMTSAVIPSYRLPDAPIAQDIQRIKEAGVHVLCGVRVGRDISLQDLRTQGYENIVLAAGAQKGRSLGIDGEDADGVYDALDFLEAVRHGKAPKIGPTVLVIGGGNSAMDAARTAIRLAGADGNVIVVYRRTLEQMPADPDEIQAAWDEGATLQVLRAPVKVEQRGGKVTALVCSHMKLGEVDRSGRPRPVPIEGSDSPILCDTIIVGISQEPILDFLGDAQPKMWKDGTLVVDPDTCETSIPNLFAGGDLARGPATVIQAIADGRRIAKTIALRENLSVDPPPTTPEPLGQSELLQRRSTRIPTVHEPEIPLQARRGFDEVLGPLPTDQAMIEADRCLVCHTMCSLCVTVCPNRANQMYVVKPFKADLPILSVQGGELIVDGTQSFAIDQTYQIVNLADFCNECGNCTTFCPTAGAPFRDKPRLHLSQESYEKAWYDAYRVVPEGEGVMVMARLGGREHRLMCSKDGIRYEGQGVTVQFDGATFGMIEAEAAQELPEGLRIDLSIAARMMIVSNARSVLVE
jgi:putative selenate reductase